MVQKGILSTQEILRWGSCFKVGNGWNVDFINDHWVPGLELKLPQVKEGPETVIVVKVANLLNHESTSWDERKLVAIFEQEDVAAIQKLELPLVSCKDKLCWTLSEDSKFSVRSYLEVIHGANSNQDKYIVWGFIWGFTLHERLKIFVWHIAFNVVPVKKVVFSRIGTWEISCGLCGQEEKVVMHLFKKCSV